MKYAKYSPWHDSLHLLSSFSHYLLLFFLLCFIQLEKVRNWDSWAQLKELRMVIIVGWSSSELLDVGDWTGWVGEGLNTGRSRKVCSLTLKVMFIFKLSGDEGKAASILCRKEHFVSNSLVLKSSWKELGHDLTAVMRQTWNTTNHKQAKA